MPSCPRDKPRSLGGKMGDEEFVLYLQGIPSHCRWQELKDFVRQSALHIRQAVVYDDQYGYPTGLGQIIVKNEHEAWRTFHRLARNGWDGQPLTVTLARASSPTQPIAGPACGPSFVNQRSFSRSQSVQMQITAPSSPVFSDDYAVSPISATHSIADTVSSAPPSNLAYANLPPAPIEHVFRPITWNGSGKTQFPVSIIPPTFPLPFNLAPSSVYPPGISMMPAPPDVGYAKVPYGSPIGCYSTQGYQYDLPDMKEFARTNLADTRRANCTISIHNLGKHVTGDMLTEHLCLAGALERFDGPQNGQATATFRREEDAERAVRLLNDLSNKHYSLGRFLRVRVCRDGASSPEPESCASEEAVGSGDDTAEGGSTSPVSPSRRSSWPNPLSVKPFVPSDPDSESTTSKTTPSSRRDSGKALLEPDGTVPGSVTSFPLVVNGSSFGRKGSIDTHEVA